MFIVNTVWLYSSQIRYWILLFNSSIRSQSDLQPPIRLKSHLHRLSFQPHLFHVDKERLSVKCTKHTSPKGISYPPNLLNNLVSPLFAPLTLCVCECMQFAMLEIYLLSDIVSPLLGAKINTKHQIPLRLSTTYRGNVFFSRK